MKSIVKWCVALAAFVGVVFLSGAWTAQDKKPVPQQGKAQASEATAKDHAARMAEHMAALKKALPTLKTPLSEAISIAEKERKGKAHGADVELTKDGKLQIEVRLLVGDKFEEVYVDHETKKVTVPEKEHEHEEGDDDDEGEEDEDGR
jgi:uncharacterized membrane protein YkoI